MFVKSGCFSWSVNACSLKSFMGYAGSTAFSD